MIYYQKVWCSLSNLQGTMKRKALVLCLLMQREHFVPEKCSAPTCMVQVYAWLLKVQHV
jgi:hypothetical protein